MAWFFVLEKWGLKMTLGREIEHIRLLRNLSVLDVCNAMGISEPEYSRLIVHQYYQTVFQLIMFVSLAECPLESLL